MRIAVFDHVGNYGGGSRFSRALLIAIKSQYPSTEIVYFGNNTSILRENLKNDFRPYRIIVKNIYSNNKIKKLGYKITKLGYKVTNIIRNIFPFLSPIPINSKLIRRINKLAKGFDVAFFPWPYFLEYPRINCPVVGVFHDFNYKYFWGSTIYNEEQLSFLEQHIPIWLKNSVPVVSSRFTACELAKFFPKYASKVKIVHLAPFAISQLDKDIASEIIIDLGIMFPYLIYPTNQCPHKNIRNLLSAIYYLQQKGVELTLVITGPGTQGVTGTATEFGLEVNTNKPNVIGLGYVTNDQIDALIQCATAVITPSFYEAGNGPGLDAWSRGIPVIMSDIPSFTEHMEILEVKATLFDPKNPHDIAEKIQHVISNYDKVHKDAISSQNKIKKHLWKDVAQSYHQIFEEICHGNNQNKH